MGHGHGGYVWKYSIYGWFGIEFQGADNQIDTDNLILKSGGGLNPCVGVTQPWLSRHGD